jgi:hypothetical protein
VHLRSVRPGLGPLPMRSRRNTTPTPPSAPLLASSKALAAALDRAEPRGNLPGLGPESVAPSRPFGPIFAIGSVLPTVPRCCVQLTDLETG